MAALAWGCGAGASSGFGAVTLQVQPVAAKLVAGQTQQFQSTVSGTTDQRVVWLVNGVAGGNAKMGTITGAGLYTAPSGISAMTVASIAAQSVAAPTQTAKATVSVSPGSTPTSAVAVAISPLSAVLVRGAAQQFTASVTGTPNTGVTWAVNGVIGGNTASGTISAGGLYSAPTSLAAAISVTVTATSAADVTKSAQAGIAIQVPVTVSVAPASVTLAAGGTQQFTAAVGGTAKSAVIWTLSPPVGTLSSAGLYTAPASVTSPQTVTVKVVSIADSAQSASAAVRLSPPVVVVQPGGLTSLATPAPGANLLANPGFEQGKTGWDDNGFTVDAAVSHGGQSSLRLVNANLIPYSQMASQTLQLKKGLYRISGWVKLSAMAAARGTGVGFCLYAPVAWPPSIGAGCTDFVKGTADWQYLQFTNIVVSQDSAALFRIDTYGDPDGTAWFDDVSVVNLSIPLETFMMYPNYRGYLFSDWSQTLQFHLTVNPPDGDVSHYRTKYTVVDETTGSPVTSGTSAAAADTTLAIQASGWPRGHSYAVTLELDLASDGSMVYTYPPYRVITRNAAERASMGVVIDPDNRILLNGTPTFLIGAYTSGMSTHTDVAGWQAEYGPDFHMGEFAAAGGNMNNPYTIGNAGNSAILPMYQYLQGLTTPVWSTYAMNCNNGNTTTAARPWWFSTQWPNWPAGEIPARVSAPGFLGFYLADECSTQTVSDAFLWASRTAKAAPDRINTGVLGHASDAMVWRDTLDVFGIDPYYIDGPAGYPLGNTWRDIAQSKTNLYGSRPILGAMQYYQRAGSRWPTQDDLRSVSYMAIVGGANGLTYWSLGINGLMYICDGSDAAHSPSGAATWCQAALDEYSSLKNVVAELGGIQSALAGVDDPSRLAGNSQPGAIKTRVKVAADGKRYLIAVNVTATTVSSTFTSAAALPGSVAVYREARSVAPAGAAFTDTFAPYAAHVYILY